MIRKLAPFAAVLALAACRTPSQPFEGHPVLADIDFVGNRSIGKGELLSKIVTAPTNQGFFFMPKTARYYDADLFAIDVKRIVRWYNQKGFYEAKVTDVEEIPDPEGRISLRVHIDEGKQAFIRKMNYLGVDELQRPGPQRVHANQCEGSRAAADELGHRAKGLRSDEAAAIAL